MLHGCELQLEYMRSLDPHVAEAEITYFEIPHQAATSRCGHIAKKKRNERTLLQISRELWRQIHEVGVLG